MGRRYRHVAHYRHAVDLCMAMLRAETIMSSYLSEATVNLFLDHFDR